MREAVKSALRKLLGVENARKLGKAVRPKKVKWSPPPPDGKVRLNLGCGDKILEGYINVDFAESRKGSKPDMMRTCVPCSSTPTTQMKFCQST